MQTVSGLPAITGFLFGRELPLGIYQESFHEYRTRLLTLTPAEAAQNVEEQIQRYEDNFLAQTEILEKKQPSSKPRTALHIR